MAFIKYLDPRNDYAFKRVFGNENNKEVLIHFLNDMVEFKNHRVIQDITFLNPILDPETAAKKQSILDVLCRDECGDQYIVEMQIAKTEGFDKRAQYYAATIYARQLVKGDNYRALKEVVFLAITDFVMFEDKEDYKSNHVLLDKKTHEHDLKDFSFTFVELPKFNKTLDQLETMEEKWTYFLKHGHETTEADAEKLMKDIPVLKEAYQALNKCAMSDLELHTYDRFEKWERDARAIENYKIKRAVEEAVEEAVETAVETAVADKNAVIEVFKATIEKLEIEKVQGIKEVAINLLMQGMQETVIAKVTGLSLQQILNLRTALPKVPFIQIEERIN